MVTLAATRYILVMFFIYNGLLLGVEGSRITLLVDTVRVLSADGPGDTRQVYGVLRLDLDGPPQLDDDRVLVMCRPTGEVVMVA